MKKQKNSTLIITLLIVSFVCIFSKADAVTMVDTTTATGISNTLNTAPTTNAPAIRDRIRADVDSKVQNMRYNQDVKNQMIENGYRIATTTTPRPPLSQKNIKLEKIGTSSPLLNQKIKSQKIENRMEDRDGEDGDSEGENWKNREDNKLKNVQTNRLNEKFEERKENREENKIMALEMLKEKRDNLGKNLEVALKNLVELRKRIVSRMEKDRNAGKDITKVKELLVIADAKISTAKQAVEAVKSYKPENFVQNTGTVSRCITTNDSSNSNVSSSTQRCLPIDKPVDLEGIRALVYKAQLAIKDAHKALNDVVVAIAKISGNNPKDRPATSTPISTVTPRVETTLPTTIVN